MKKLRDYFLSNLSKMLNIFQSIVVESIIYLARKKVNSHTFDVLQFRKSSCSFSDFSPPISFFFYKINNARVRPWLLYGCTIQFCLKLEHIFIPVILLGQDRKSKDTLRESKMAPACKSLLGRHRCDYWRQMLGDLWLTRDCFSGWMAL